MENIDKKLNNTIKIVYSVLNDNKENQNVQKSYEEIKIIAKKRKII